MLEFLHSEFQRLSADPLGRLPGYVTLITLFGFAALKPFLNVSGTFVGAAKVVQFMAFAMVIAVTVAFLQQGPATAIGFYIAGAFVLLKLNRDNFFEDDDWFIGCSASIVTYHFSFLALVATGEPDIDGFTATLGTVGAAVLHGLMLVTAKDAVEDREQSQRSVAKTETTVLPSGVRVTRRVKNGDLPKSDL